MQCRWSKQKIHILSPRTHIISYNNGIKCEINHDEKKNPSFATTFSSFIFVPVNLVLCSRFSRYLLFLSFFLLLQLLSTSSLRWPCYALYPISLFFISAKPRNTSTQTPLPLAVGRGFHFSLLRSWQVSSSSAGKSFPFLWEMDTLHAASSSSGNAPSIFSRVSLTLARLKKITSSVIIF